MTRTLIAQLPRGNSAEFVVDERDHLLVQRASSVHADRLRSYLPAPEVDHAKTGECGTGDALLSRFSGQTGSSRGRTQAQKNTERDGDSRELHYY